MDLQTVDYLAELSRMDIPQEEKEGFLKDLQAIIGFIDTVQSITLDTPTTNEQTKVNVFREDTVASLAPAYDLIEAAPGNQDHFVRVPKVIE